MTERYVIIRRYYDRVYGQWTSEVLPQYGEFDTFEDVKAKADELNAANPAANTLWPYYEWDLA